MPDADHGDKPAPDINQSGSPRIRPIWGIGYIKRKLHDRRAKYEAQNPEEKAAWRTANATVWIAIFTVVLAIVGGITLFEVMAGGSDTHDLAVQAKNQADRMKDLADRMKEQAENTRVLGQDAEKANEIADRQIRIDQRPWLKIIFLGDDPEHAKEAYNTTNYVIGGPLKIPLRIVNVGKTPAFHIVANFVIELVPVGKEPHIPSGSRSRSKFAVQQARTSVIYQGGGLLDVPVGRVGDLGNGKIREVPVSLEESLQINSKTAYAVVWGRVRYSDAFGVSHWTKYCNAVMSGTSYFDSAKCPAYGGMDNNSDPPQQTRQRQKAN